MVKASARVDKYSKSDIIVSPSILSANFSKLGEQVRFQLRYEKMKWLILESFLWFILLLRRMCSAIAALEDFVCRLSLRK